MKRWLQRTGCLVSGFVVALVVMVSGGRFSEASNKRVRQAIVEFNPSVDERVVRSGDTLWDISEEVLGRPELWPRVWAMNPEITNPHWIYPGDVVRFYPSQAPEPSVAASALNLGGVEGDWQETQAEVKEVVAEEPAPKVAAAGGGEAEAEAEAVAEGQAGTVAAAPAEVAYLEEEAEVDEVELVDTMDESVVARKAGRKGVYSGLFVSEARMVDFGEISNASPDKAMLAEGDVVFLETSTLAQAGDQFLVFQTLREVDHPVTGRFFGYLTEITGVVVVEEVRGDVARARIRKSYSELARGQKLTPFVREPFSQLEASGGPEGEIEGSIVLMSHQLRSIDGSSSLVVVDKGRNDGLREGHRLAVLGEGIATLGRVFGLLEKIPTFEVSVGELLVLDAKEKSATCLVTRALSEITAGSPVRSISANASSSANK